MWKRFLRGLRRTRIPLPAPAAALTLCAGLVLSLLLFGWMRGAEQERERYEFGRAAELRFAAVTRSFNDAVRALRAVNLLFAASSDVSRAEFDQFAGPLLEVHPEVRALTFQRFVRGDERAAFEAARRRDWPGFGITERGPGGLVPAAARPLYLVVDYVVPFAGNETTFGYDAWSYPPQRARAEYAIDTGRPAASGIVPLLQAHARPGIVMVMAVYRPGPPPRGPDARPAIGTTEVVLDLDALVGHNLKLAGLLDRAGVYLTIRDLSPGSARAAYVYGGDGALAGWRRWLAAAPMVAVRTIEVAGSRWQLAVTATGAALPGHLGSSGVLALSLLLTFVTAGYVQARAQRTRRIERLVAERTGALRRASAALRLYQLAVESSPIGIILVDARRPGFPIEYVNPAYERLSGRRWRDLRGRPITELADEPDQPAFEELRSALRERRPGHALLRQRDAHGGFRYSDVHIAPVNDPGGQTDHFVVSVNDVTTAKRYEAELELHALYDGLTGLANRAQLAERLEQAIASAAATGERLWVVALDLDQFRFINDTLGHAAGDELLRQVAPRITRALPRTATVARTGGDEFVLLLPGASDERAAAAIVRGVLDALAEPLQVAGQSLLVTGSAGVAAYPGDGQDGPTLIKHAEVAMYRAKEAGRNTVQFYRPALTARALERLELEGALRHALAHEEFELHYQPQVDLASGRVVGMEALLRWRHPRLGLVHPGRFIGLAEETGLIVPIGAWVLRAAARQALAWQRAGYGPLRVAVNLSARQFAEPGLADEVAAVLAETGLDPERLEIEVTESLVMTDVEAAIATMHRFKAMGVAMSIDDFGTGYSSLSYLKRFPVDVLKIDRSFVHDLAADAGDVAVVDAIISLARGLRMRVIAEGVETLAQLDCLRVQGCDLVQGHVYSRALPAEEAEQLLRAGLRVVPNAAAA